MIYYLYLLVRQLFSLGKTGNYRGRYHKYLGGPVWAINRKLVIFYRLFGPRFWLGGVYCELCGYRGKGIAVHHRHYAHIFWEWVPFFVGDFLILCRSCHAKQHTEKDF